MPNAVDAWTQLKSVVETAWMDHRVVPITPEGRSPAWPGNEEGAVKPRPRDKTSSWSAYIGYTDGQGHGSERRVTCLNVLAGIGGTLSLGAYCHEARAYREFRVDRIQELIDLGTGEVMEPHAYFAALRQKGLPFANPGMEAFAKILVFMVRCDGHDDPREWTAMEDALARYALRFGGDDSDIEEVMTKCRSLAPDGEDFGLALRRLLRAPPDVRHSVADLCGRACGEVVDADGRLLDSEIHWGAAVDRCLSIIRS